MKGEVRNDSSESSLPSTNSSSSPSKAMVLHQGGDVESPRASAAEESKQSAMLSNDGTHVNNDRVLDAAVTAQKEKLQNSQEMISKLSSIVEASLPSDNSNRSTSNNHDGKEKHSIIASTFLASK